MLFFKKIKEKITSKKKNDKSNVLQNLKNQKIPVPRRIVPMIYTGLQRISR